MQRAANGVLPAVVALTVVAALLRFATLHTQSYWYDEAVTVDLVRRSFGGMLSGVAHSESTPPLYYLFAWAWSKVFGTGEMGLRSLSAVFGTASVPVAYAGARTFVGRRSSLVAAALVAVSPFLVWYSQEARAYALLVLLAAASLACLRRPAVWAIVASLALAAHYFAVFLVAAEAVWLVRRSADRPAVRRAVAGVAVTAGVLAPLAAYQARYSQHTAWIYRSGSVTGRAAYLLHQLVVGAYPASYLRPLIVAVAIAVAVGVFAWTEGADRHGATVALALGLAAIAAPAILAALGDRLAGGRGDYFIYRNVIAAVVPLTIATGAVLQRAGVAAVVLVCILLASVSIEIARRPELQRPDIRSVGFAIGEPQPERLVVADARTATVLEVYLRVAEPAPGARVDVRDIDLVLDPRIPEPAAGLPDFRRLRVDHVHGFTIVHLRSPRAVALRPRELGRRLRTELGFDVAVLRRI